MSRFKRVKRRIWAFDGETRRRKTDYVAGEEPLQIQLSAGRAGGTSGRTVAITMRTPGNDYELAAGFLFSEGVIRHKLDVVQMTYCVGEERDQQEYNFLDVRLRAEQLPDLPTLDRHVFTSSACGICGATVLDDLSERNLPDLPPGPSIAPSVLHGLPDALRNAQRLFESTGGLHAAALFDAEGTLLQVREDVGRHNALDKLVGWALMQGELPLHERIVLVSGRASYELVQKCVVAGAPLLCAVSAPSSLAVETAERFGVTLVGFLREERFNVYAGHERIATRS